MPMLASDDGCRNPVALVGDMGRPLWIAGTTMKTSPHNCFAARIEGRDVRGTKAEPSAPGHRRTAVRGFVMLPRTAALNLSANAASASLACDCRFFLERGWPAFSARSHKLGASNHRKDYLRLAIFISVCEPKPQAQKSDIDCQPTRD